MKDYKEALRLHVENLGWNSRWLTSEECIEIHLNGSVDEIKSVETYLVGSFDFLSIADVFLFNPPIDLETNEEAFKDSINTLDRILNK